MTDEVGTEGDEEVAGTGGETAWWWWGQGKMFR